MLAFGFGFKSCFLLVFFIHMLVISFILLIDGVRKSERSNSWLALLLVLCCMYIAPFMFGYAGWYARDGYREFLFYVPFQQILIIGPVTYFYVKSLLFQEFRIQAREFIHLLPGIIYNIYIILLFVLDSSIYGGDHFYADGRDKDLDLWYQIAGFVSMNLYFGLSLRRYLRYRKAIFESVSYAEEITFTWVGRFLVALLGLLVLRLLFFILNPEWAEFGNKFWYYALFSIIFYFIAIYGYRHAIKREGFFNPPIPKGENFIHENDESTSKDSERVTIENLDFWKIQMDDLMNEKALYTNAQLSLVDVSKELNTNSRNISQIINQGFEMNFNDFINKYRSQAMVEKIKNGEHDRKTLLSLAFECGFNSKSTFNRAFKKYTGKTPMQFIKNLD